MRRITLLAALMMGAVAGAQVTYEWTDFAAANEEFTMTKASGFLVMNFAQTGANHNWNYSGLNADSQTVASWQNPNNSGYKLAWCLTHLYILNCNSQFNNNFTHSKAVMDDLEFMDYALTNVVEHSRANSSSFAHRMRGLTATVQGISLPATIDYDDPDEVYHFPMVYGESYTTTGHFMLDLNALTVPFSYELTTERTNTVEGWGSLTTPYGTFPNVLKLKTVLQKTETFSYQGINIPIPTTTVSYQWFDKNYGMPVLQADGFSLFGVFVPISVTYLDGPQCLQPAPEFAMTVTDYNGETGNAVVAFTNISSNFDSASWDFGDGNSSNGTNVSHEYTCPGTYDVTLTITNSTCQPPTSASVTQSVTVLDPQNFLTTSITLGDASLAADRVVPGTTYQWIDCDNGNAIIEGATSQIFHPTMSGNYACLLDTNGCTAMSDCQLYEMLGVSNDSFQSIRIYPNPTTGQLHLSANNLTDLKVNVFNSIGMLVSDKLDISAQPSGVYIVKITSAEGGFVRKVIKR